jgi:hypothetical protein
LLISQDKTRSIRELTAMVLARAPKLCNFLEWRDKKVIYKRFSPFPQQILHLLNHSFAPSRYASLFFIACVDNTDNELITLEKIHLFVEILDRYFGNVNYYLPLYLLSLPHRSVNWILFSISTKRIISWMKCSSEGIFKRHQKLKFFVFVLPWMK